VKAGWDVIFIARKGAEKAQYQQLKQAIDSLLRRNHLMAPEDTVDYSYPATEHS
jgi:ribonuclease P protein component